MEHRRHHVRVGDAVLLDQRERRAPPPSRPSSRSGTPIAAGAVSENDSGAAWYSGPVQRCTCRWPRYCVSCATPSAPRGSGGRRTPFGPTGRARRVEHRGCRRPGRRCRCPSSGASTVVPALEPVDVAADGDDRARSRGARSAASRATVGEARVGDERRRFAVVDDVARLVAGEVPVDGREPQPGALRGRDRLHELGPVRAHQRDAVARLHAACPQRAHQPVRVRVQLGPGAVARLGDHRRTRRRSRPPRTRRACPDPPLRGAVRDRARSRRRCLPLALGHVQRRAGFSGRL